MAKVNILGPKRNKIGPKTVDTVFIGYAHNSSANRFLVINSNVSEISNNTIIEARDATFFENIFSFKTNISNKIVGQPSTSQPSSKNNIDMESEIEIRKSKRQRIEKNSGNDFYVYQIEDIHFLMLCHLKMLLFGKKLLIVKYNLFTE